MEATIIEETWTENALSIVSKVRTSQEDVDKIADWLYGFKVGSATLNVEDLAFEMNANKSILSGIVNDIDTRLVALV